MLLENIFCASLMLFCVTLAAVTFVSSRRLDKAMLLSGLVTIITAIMWIWRAWS